jgi:hypothetical protein|tara:strand:- start:2197 stop:2541 length:345 start_codon:yes stop_codon:yes gene_type:complete
MCSPFIRKEANRYYWLVKGQLIPKSEPDNVVEDYYLSYFKRLWNNESGCMDEYERGFEQAYKRREAEILNESKSHSMGLVQEGTSILGYSSYEREREEQILSESRDHVAVLGYN